MIVTRANAEGLIGKYVSAKTISAKSYEAGKIVGIRCIISWHDDASYHKQWIIFVEWRIKGVKQTCEHSPMDLDLPLSAAHDTWQ